MIRSIQKLKQFLFNTNILRTLKLIFTLAPLNTVFVVLFILLENISIAYVMLLLKKLIDKLPAYQQGSSQDSDIQNILLRLTVCGSLYIIFRYIAKIMADKQASDVSHYIDDRIHQQTAALNLAYFENSKFYDQLTLSQKSNPYQIVLTIMEIFKGMVFFFSICYVLVSIHILLPFIMLLLIIPMIIAKIYFSHKYHIWNVQKAETKRKSVYFSDTILKNTYTKEIKSFQLSDYIILQYQKFRDELEQKNIRINKITATVESCILLACFLAFVIAINFMLKEIKQQEIAIGGLSIFLVTFPQVFNLLQYLSNSSSVLYQQGISMNHVYALLGMPINAEVHADRENVISRNEPLILKLSDVSFKYPEASNNALSDVQMTIQSGKIIALVGENGAGKSTLLKIILRLYTPISGRIQINDTPIDQIPLKEYRSLFAPVFQDFGKYQFSLKENIIIGANDQIFDAERYKMAIQIAQLENIIDKLPLKDETQLGVLFSTGIELSIGEWQRVAIARAIYRNAPFIILDEPTSALDNTTELHIFQNIKKYLPEKAVLVISHRKSTIEKADFIYVLQDGQVAQEGTPEMLSQDLNGLYFKEISKPHII